MKLDRRLKNTIGAYMIWAPFVGLGSWLVWLLIRDGLWYVALIPTAIVLWYWVAIRLQD